MSAAILTIAGAVLCAIGLIKSSEAAGIAGIICVCSSYICLEISKLKGGAS